jgi:catechol 2,3-dioxygenase-like lactoylglutathione lyase family enzyme
VSLRVHHLALRVADCERSLAFYSGVLGLPERKRFEGDAQGLRSVWVDAGGVVLMLERTLRGAGSQEGSGHVLALQVDDHDACEAALRAAAITVEDRTAHTLYVRDPDGHRVGLSTYPFA